MTDEDKNRIITEALNLCWHDCPILDGGTERITLRGVCSKCGIGEENPDFSTWPGFGIIMERGPGRKWWESFLNSGPGLATFRDYLIESYYLNPPRMRDTLATWLKEHEGEWRERSENHVLMWID